MALAQPQLFDLIRSTASWHALEPSLLLALAEQESSFNTWAMRYEPSFYEHYVRKNYPTLNTEAAARSTSYGLCQVMGEVAREMGFTGPFLTMLCDESTGLDYGARMLHKCITEAGTVSAGLLRYNGGGNPQYAAQVLEKQKKYAS